jgi:hypothetical protein
MKRELNAIKRHACIDNNTIYYLHQVVWYCHETKFLELQRGFILVKCSKTFTGSSPHKWNVVTFQQLLNAPIFTKSTMNYWKNNVHSRNKMLGQFG